MATSRCEEVEFGIWLKHHGKLSKLLCKILFVFSKYFHPFLSPLVSSSPKQDFHSPNIFLLFPLSLFLLRKKYFPRFPSPFFTPLQTKYFFRHIFSSLSLSVFLFFQGPKIQNSRIMQNLHSFLGLVQIEYNTAAVTFYVNEWKGEKKIKKDY